MRGACLLLVLLAACEPVPEIQFVDDAGPPPPEAGASDAGADAPPCSGRVPPTGANAVCCGSVWCSGTCDAESCQMCEMSSCTELCCARKTGPTTDVLCKPKCP